MFSENHIILHNLFFSIPNSKVSFVAVNQCFKQKRYGIVGDNGIGKTSLFQLITHTIKPHEGAIKTTGTISYYQQSLDSYKAMSIAQVLNIEKKITALERISNGSIEPSDYELIGDDWDLETKISKQLELFNINNIKLDQDFSTLSGGQQTKLLLAKVTLSQDDFILLDEPTNNLDKNSRELLYQWINNYSKGLIIISHDRELLNKMDEIIELNQHGINHYGGNYDFYIHQKKLEQSALLDKINIAQQEMKKSSNSIQLTKEKHQQKTKKGKALRKSGSIDKLTANSKMGRSEKTLSRNNTLEQRMQQNSHKNLEQAKLKLEIKTHIQANLNATKIGNNKTVLNIENLNFSHPNSKKILNNFNLNITGPERTAINGNNGSGKTTLIKLILNHLKPNSGEIILGINNYCYLDQSLSGLDKNLTILENYLKFNPNLNIEQAYFNLASMNFRNISAEKRIENLSGGEKIRAGLAINLLAQTPPQLIILDEPTNHLDITSIEAIESMLNNYQGAMIVISHDQKFLENIKIDREITLIDQQ